MAKGKAGADSAVPVTSQIQGKNLIQCAEDVFGAAPVLWGRYFTSTSTSGDVEYRHLKENQILRQKNVRVLPIARQTKRVGGTQAQGSLDAEANVEDLIITFGRDYLSSQGGKFFMFLDVEGAPSLSAAYYMGWAQTLVSHSAAITNNGVQLLPCVYATQLDDPTWQAVASCAEQGVQCGGAWVAHWVHRGCHNLDDWQDAAVTPKTALPCKVLLWQYADDCFGGTGFDSNQTNPGIDLEHEFLARLILPPDMTGGV
jgi:hypothetical protein